MASTMLPGLANIPRTRLRYGKYHLPSTTRAISSSFFGIRRHFPEAVDNGFRLGVVKPMRVQETNKSFATAADGNTPYTATEDPDPIIPTPVDHPIPNVLPSHRFDKPVTTIAGASRGPGLELDENKQDRKNSKTNSVDTKSDDYSSTMTHAMGAVLTYRHELGMNYNFVLPDLIVGSCLQTPSDVDRLKKVGVKTVFCLQQDPDLEYFGVDVRAIQARAKEIGGIEHIRAEIRDFDPFDLRKRLPAVVATLYRAVQRNKGIAYIHCTAGLGRAPAVALAYMHWLLGYDLLDANEMLLSVRPCFPKLEAIRNATCDLLTGDAKELIQLKWPDNDCQSVEISGLDVGWGQMVPLTLVPKKKYWILNRELLVGKYEYKYVVDGLWTTNPHEPLTQPNKDGHINNFVEVLGESEDANAKSLRRRLMRENPELNDVDRKIIRRKLLSLPSE